MLLYYITDRTQFPGTESQRREKLLEEISAAARAGVDFIQLREKDLSSKELESIARNVVETVRAVSDRTRILINSRVDAALVAGADGVHLRSTDITASEVCRIWREAGTERTPMVAVSCHSEEDVAHAASSRADFVVFGPIFEKGNTVASGLESLRRVSRCSVPVLALGGVNLANAVSCLEAGAAGIAGIRLFQEGDIEETVAKLRALSK